MDIFGSQTDIGNTPNETGAPAVKRPDDFGNIFELDDKKPENASVKMEREIPRPDQEDMKPEKDERSEEYGDIFGYEEKPIESDKKQQFEKQEVIIEKKEGDIEEDASAEDLNNEKPGKESPDDQSKEEEDGVDGLKKRARTIDRKVQGTPRIDPIMFRAMDVSEPESEDEKNYPAIYDNELNSLDDKPWREADADLTDWFNYGFDEDSWRAYCAAQVKMRLKMSKKKDTDYQGADEKNKNPPNRVKIAPMIEKRGSPLKNRTSVNPVPAAGAWRPLAERGICFDFQYKGFCSRANCKWLHNTGTQDVRKPPPIPTKIPVPRPPPVVGVSMGPTPGFAPPPPVNPVTGISDVQNFMEQLRPVSSMMHPSIIGRVHGSRDKKRKRSRRSRSRSRTRR